jgi:S1-C subfamily serine protease
MKLFLDFFRRNKKKTDTKEKYRGDENTLFIGDTNRDDSEETNVLGSKETSSGEGKTTLTSCKDSYYRKGKNRAKHRIEDLIKEPICESKAIRAEASSSPTEITNKSSIHSILLSFIAFVLIPLSAHVILDEEGVAKAKGFFQSSAESLKERFVSNHETVIPSINVDDVVQKATVKVLSLDKDAAAVPTEGSGTLIRCTDGSCQVLTNAHVINGNSTLSVVTHDGQQHEGTVVETYGSNSSLDDVGLIEFQSEVAYAGIPLSSSDPVTEEEVTAAGYLFGSNKISMLDGNLTAILSEPLENGYRLGYSIDIKQGMSGGPLINREGQLIGINGKRSHPVSIFGNTRYLFKDGREVSELPLQELNEYSWAIPTETLQRFL